jgi:hypothetical protein
VQKEQGLLQRQMQEEEEREEEVPWQRSFLPGERGDVPELERVLFRVLRRESCALAIDVLRAEQRTVRKRHRLLPERGERGGMPVRSVLCLRRRDLRHAQRPPDRRMLCRTRMRRRVHAQMFACLRGLTPDCTK